MTPNVNLELLKTIQIIQGGMGVYISTPFLAKSVSMNGGLGTISGVAPDRIFALILQNGDPGGHYRRALSHFPFQDKARKVLDAFFIEGGKNNPKFLNRRGVPFYSVNPSSLLISLIVCANFSFVWLAKEGHNKPVSMNYLEKIAMPHIYAIFGAMLSGIDVITMGAGIPRYIPDVITEVLEGRIIKYPVPVSGENIGEDDRNIREYWMSFEPEKFFGAKIPPMKRPAFIPIISSYVLAKKVFCRIEEEHPGSISGFVVEESTAGGHNAPAREGLVDTTTGEPIYTDKDKVDYKKLCELGFPFWIGGSYPTPEKLKFALLVGASGIQVGTIFALCEESGMDPKLRNEVRRLGYRGQLRVKTSPKASPTGYPFKVACLPGTLSEDDVYQNRERICNQGALVELYWKSDKSIGYRCSAEPIEHYLAKGGKIEETANRCCICNGLIATAGLSTNGKPPIVTTGDYLGFLNDPKIMRHENDTYHVWNVFNYLDQII